VFGPAATSAISLLFTMQKSESNQKMELQCYWKNILQREPERRERKETKNAMTSCFNTLSEILSLTEKKGIRKPVSTACSLGNLRKIQLPFLVQQN